MGDDSCMFGTTPQGPDHMLRYVKREAQHCVGLLIRWETPTFVDEDPSEAEEATLSVGAVLPNVSKAGPIY